MCEWSFFLSNCLYLSVYHECVSQVSLKAHGHNSHCKLEKGYRHHSIKLELSMKI